ncbi:polysaccharide pyruvyl transferase family protein [Arthrobacter gengyunqii]|uniref:Polysaccharide pyruvyl transferase family protein n=1 Tax=Arthrobacter gengyunqii TaxID=2886940 RepID=A0ABS8GMT7_9MICC|nr:polysaccharide pyruvyl transferase family protein [Arthrobacter gengyunqii]MCC3266568.1 polysaccharide pyruvyl transferase family protein [Arthrobacter gengyunqii]
MEDYILAMKARAYAAFDEVFDGVKCVKYVDFPDHRNVGDAAIAIGQLEYFRARSVKVESIHSLSTFDRRLLKSHTPVVIHGGGNIAGLYNGVDEHRNLFGKALMSETLLIQAPQSIHFATEKARKDFFDHFLARERLRVAVRDSEAFSLVKHEGQKTYLAPDAVHLLGHIDSPSPSRRCVVLKRQDNESAVGDGQYASIDWPKDRGMLALTASIRWRSKYSGPVKPLFNLSSRRWQELAEKRFERGIRLLSTGETVVTDRLHAMLVALQMGRNVIAVDNNNRKLTKYAETWFQDTVPNVQFASSFEDAMKRV